MKDFWLKKGECTGCAACANICPKNAIHMEADVCGFSYPVINDKCISCNACQKTCESRLQKATNHAAVPETYAAWSKDPDLRFTSTSGGVFSELAKVVIAKGGCVLGAQYNEKHLVEHVIVSDENGLEHIKQSKYIQSEIGIVYREVKERLRNSVPVAFCGTPCQIAGLYAYLGKDYDNLTTIDFICRGINSPKAYQAWLQEIEENEGKRVVKVWFKYKENGWKRSPRCVRLDFSDGTNTVVDGDANLFMTGYLGPNLYIRSSCGQCQYKGIPRQGDITLADFWKVYPALDDDQGTSMVLCNSAKGETLFEAAKLSLYYHKRSFDEILAGNVCFKSSVDVPRKSEKFLKALDKVKFSTALRKFTKESLYNKMLRKTKNTILVFLKLRKP